MAAPDFVFFLMVKRKSYGCVPSRFLLTLISIRKRVSRFVVRCPSGPNPYIAYSAIPYSLHRCPTFGSPYIFECTNPGLSLPIVLANWTWGMLAVGYTQRLSSLLFHQNLPMVSTHRSHAIIIIQCRIASYVYVVQAAPVYVICGQLPVGFRVSKHVTHLPGFATARPRVSGRGSS